MEDTTLVIKFVGRSKVTGKSLQPPAFVSLANRKVMLPDAKTQLEGFKLDKLEDTVEVARTFPMLYKEFIVKGNK